jgi:hypothetical protein
LGCVRAGMMVSIAYESPVHQTPLTAAATWETA